ncbi:uracil-DNA glycosylase family protein [Lacibacter sediminis]|uniref:Uracil-DNA glycosylase-like domain-containing protein n=1 Tax=Lacibacter sediminis TaxID=2760713 RepID=A0A7G5XLW9_9BACT|nr:hypothetical protein [Lacibacter sediminis]QNA46472.1 hypothetical protein H4075_09960 [Lacibacter sediminis]
MPINTQAILKHYRKRFPFERFYDNLVNNIATWPAYHLKSETFLQGYESQNKTTQQAEKIITGSNDIRVDLPVWFGNLSSPVRIAVMGLEPRNSDPDGILNIERVGQYVFATPFALERPRGPYYAAFQDLLNSNNLFVYFTDVVKSYLVSGDKKNDDRIARQLFWKRAKEEEAFLVEELALINPTFIIALGNESFAFLSKLLSNKYQILKIRHPSQGGARIAREQLAKILQQP